MSQAQHAQKLGDVAAGAGIVAVLIESGSKFDQQLKLLLRAELFLGELVAQSCYVAEWHWRLFGERVGQRPGIGGQRVHRGDQLNAGVNGRVAVVDDLQGGKGIHAQTVDVADPNGKDRSVQSLRVAQLGLTGLGLQPVT